MGDGNLMIGWGVMGVEQSKTLSISTCRLCLPRKQLTLNHSSHIYNFITMLLYGCYWIPSSTDAETEAQRGCLSPVKLLTQ